MMYLLLCSTLVEEVKVNFSLMNTREISSAKQCFSAFPFAKLTRTEDTAIQLDSGYSEVAQAGVYVCILVQS